MKRKPPKLVETDSLDDIRNFIEKSNYQNRLQVLFGDIEMLLVMGTLLSIIISLLLVDASEYSSQANALDNYRITLVNIHDSDVNYRYDVATRSVFYSGLADSMGSNAFTSCKNQCAEVNSTECESCFLKFYSCSGNNSNASYSSVQVKWDFLALLLDSMATDDMKIVNSTDTGINKTGMLIDKYTLDIGRYQSYSNLLRILSPFFVTSCLMLFLGYAYASMSRNRLSEKRLMDSDIEKIEHTYREIKNYSLLLFAIPVIIFLATQFDSALDFLSGNITLVIIVITISYIFLALIFYKNLMSLPLKQPITHPPSTQ